MALLTKKQDDPNLVAIRLDADPEYARQDQKLRDLRAHAAALEARRSALSEGLGRDVDRNLLTRRAETLITDAVVPMASATPSSA